MSRIRGLSAPGWFVAGILLAALVIPTTALATAATTVAIIGSGGYKAGVTPDQQVLATESTPARFFQDTPSPVLLGQALSRIAGTPVGSLALIVKVIHVDVYEADNSFDSYIRLAIAQNVKGSCGEQLGTYQGYITPSSIGEQDINMDPGLAIPSNALLCGTTDSLTTAADVSVSGYLVPSNEVPALAAPSVNWRPKILSR